MEKQTGRWKKWLNILFLALLFAVSLFAAFHLTGALQEGDISAFQKTLRNAGVAWLIAAVVFAAVAVLFDVWKLQILLKATGAEGNFRAAARAVLTGRFYDSITPLSLGGQPAQMVVLSKTEPLGAATAAPSLSYLIQSFTGILLALLLILCNRHALVYADASVRTVLTAAAGAGLFLNALGPAALLMLIFAPRLFETIARNLVKLAEKLRFVKNDSFRTRVMNGVANYKEAVRWMSKQKAKLCAAVCCNIFGTVALFSVPYCLLVSLGGVNPGIFMWIDTVTLNCYLLYSSACFPTPGGTGYMETGFSLLYGGIRLSGNVLFWIVLFWRFLTYYVFILSGLTESVVRFFSALFRRKKEEREKKEGQTRAEP